MEPNVKKISIIIIIILIGIIGGLWYLKNKESSANPSITQSNPLSLATTTNQNFDQQSYADGRNNMEEIILEKLLTNTSTLPTTKIPQKTIPFTTEKIIISQNISSTSLKSYGQQIVKALEPLSDNQSNEIILMIESLEQKNPIKAQQLAFLAVTSKKSVSDLLKIPVPKTAVTTHLNLINNLNQNATRLTEMSQILDDPYLALESANLFRIQKIKFYKAVEAVNNFFKNNNIIFSPEEGSKVYLTI